MIVAPNAAGLAGQMPEWSALPKAHLRIAGAGLQPPVMQRAGDSFCRGIAIGWVRHCTFLLT
jgi:hypothetical protein